MRDVKQTPVLAKLSGIDAIIFKEPFAMRSVEQATVIAKLSGIDTNTFKEPFAMKNVEQTPVMAKLSGVDTIIFEEPFCNLYMLSRSNICLFNINAWKSFMRKREALFW